MVTRSHQKIEDDESSFLSTLCRKDLYLAANHQHQRFPIIQDRSAADRVRLSGDQMARNLLEPLDRFFLGDSIFQATIPAIRTKTPLGGDGAVRSEVTFSVQRQFTKAGL
jgi:hypothetical protein